MHPARPVTRAAILRFALVAVFALLAAHLVDRWAFVHLADTVDGDLERMFRIAGFLGTWILAALALALHDRPLRHARDAAHRWYARGALLLGGAVAGGIAAELLKLLFRRERPRAHAGEYVFRAWAERPFSTGGLALPSSHALVAFGAVFMLAKLFPRARWVWYFVGAGCAYSRVAAGAHFVSDVVLSALVGFLVVELVWRAYLRRASPETGTASAADAPEPAREAPCAS